MTKQLITIGTPGAGGGDPAHAAFKKINDNATELYDAAIPDTEEKKSQARANLGLDDSALKIKQVNTNTDTTLINALSSADKSGYFFDAGGGNKTFAPYTIGTYASLVDGAFFAIGADPLTHTIRTLTGLKRNGAIEEVKGKQLVAKGDFGIGTTLASLGQLSKDRTGTNPNLVTGFYESLDIVGAFVTFESPYGSMLIGGSTYNGTPPQYVYYNSQNGNKDLLESKVHTFKTTQNTSIDGNGFIKAASPTGDLYADKLVLNEEAKEQAITFERIGTGDYLIKGSTGLANQGWYIEQPKDSNSNVYHTVEYGTHQNGDIWIKTYAKKINELGDVVADLENPVDIKAGRFIAIRLNELPKDENTPAFNPELDNEGNAQPTRYHILEKGVWIISDEHAALLEQERLMAMQPLKRRQFRLALVMNGFDLKAIETMIGQIKDPMQRTIAQIEWQDAGDFERTNPTLLMMAEMMELTPEQVDRLWTFGLAL